MTTAIKEEYTWKAALDELEKEAIRHQKIAEEFNQYVSMVRFQVSVAEGEVLAPTKEIILAGAAQSNYINLASYMIDQGADVNLQDKNGMSALHHAMSFRASNDPMIDLLLAKGARLDLQDNKGMTPAQFAAHKEKHVLAEKLRKLSGQQNLFDLLPSVDTSSLKAYLKENPGAVSERDNMGDTALHLAEDPEIIKVLIKAGADVNAKGHEGKTPLHYTARSNNAGKAELLIKAGAKVNRSSQYHVMPLDDAWRSRALAVMDILEKHGAVKGDDYHMAKAETR